MRKTTKLLYLPVLIVGLNLLLAGRATAQVFTSLYSFTDGANPQASLILSGQTLYGTSEDGGNSGSGSIFAINTDGTRFTNLYSFTLTEQFPFGGNYDGANPVSGLVLSGNVLYGTASRGGLSQDLQPDGTVFAINTDGTGFVKLHGFNGVDDGADPISGLVLSGSTLYGTTEFGGISGDGTVFAINTDGTGFTSLYSFNWSNDGAHPVARLILSDHILYGTTQDGGSSGYGIVFKVTTNGTDFTVLHDFTAGDDGANPEAGLILSSNILYGTTENYGSLGGLGTVFSVHTDGTCFTNLHSFVPTDNSGVLPLSELILSGNTLYGTTDSGGVSNSGILFAVNTDGTCFTNLYSFEPAVIPYNPNIEGGFPTNSDGAYPASGLILSDNTLYGTTSGGGSSGDGTIFGLSLDSDNGPQLTIIPSGANIILRWPNNVSGFILQSTTNLLSPVVWNTNLPPPVIVNGQNTVANPISGNQMFFRLSLQ